MQKMHIAKCILPGDTHRIKQSLLWDNSIIGHARQRSIIASQREKYGSSSTPFLCFFGGGETDEGPAEIMALISLN